ncbi:hypothetical protein CHLRE_14g615776v5 [Chlamydomonas reinhardtii]|uniref:Uncharacterized protein n=1 Tax=Chlamydomonas reinhardtii TaxID=3055 RepID=A0A2K3CXM4_CHLRE|nr:uncharacterized protein CHLRE_14g615776v5 [Chlamydomonas reinhardtii]PNW73023.1 hypothetical protein CHLRE_14g615776v5 [Chlamydomonas reinhardtii]
MPSKRHHRPLDVFGGAAAGADGGGGGGGGRGGGGDGGGAEVPGPVVGSRLSHLAKETLRLSDVRGVARRACRRV